MKECAQVAVTHSESGSYLIVLESWLEARRLAGVAATGTQAGEQGAGVQEGTARMRGGAASTRQSSGREKGQDSMGVG